MVLDKLYPLPAGHTLTVTVASGVAHVQQLETASVKASVTSSAAHTFGPYALDRTFRVQDGGNVTVAVAEADGALSVAEAALIAAIPAADQHDSATVWNSSGVLKVSGA